MERAAGKTAQRTRSGIAIRTIVAPTDFSESAERAVEYAAGLCQMWGGRLLLLHVTEGSHIGSLAEGAVSGKIRREMKKAAKEKLEQCRVNLEANRRVEAHIREGRGWDEIVKFAARTDADLIVVGSHGYRGLKRLALGSTAERVVRHAQCAVLVVRGS